MLAWVVAAALAGEPVAGRVFLPVDGDAEQLHPEGRAATNPQRLRWIPMWTQDDPAVDVRLVQTPEVTLAPGRARVLVEVRHHVPWGDALVRVRVSTGDVVLLDRTVTARPYADPHDGGLQPIDLTFDVPDGTGDLVAEVHSATTHRLWVGAVALTSETPRPLWVVRHCANTRDAVLRAVAQGASGVELDVMWRGGAAVVGHPAPSPPGCPIAPPQRGEALDVLLHTVGRSLREGAISLVILDVKHPDVDTDAQARTWVDLLTHAGIERTHVVWSVEVTSAGAWADAVARAAGAVPHVDAWHDAAQHALAPDWIAQSVTAGSDFLGLGADPFVSWMPMPQWIAPLTEAVNRRDDGTGPAHVYAWTLDRPASMRLVLDLGVDAVIVNHPRRLLRELATPPHDGRFRRP